MQMALTPVASLKVSRVSSSKHVKVKLLGEVSMLLGNEGYIASLPKLRMRQISSTAWGLELAGEPRIVDHTSTPDLRGPSME